MPTRVDGWAWGKRVLGWDGFLPVGIVLLPRGIDLLCPDAPGVQIAAAVLAPIAALFVRYAVGRRHLEANRFGPAFLACQQAVFVAAIFWLCIIDTAVMACHAAPAVGAFDLIALAVAFGLYLVGMMFAMYPGRTAYAPEPEEKWGETP